MLFSKSLKRPLIALVTNHQPRAYSLIIQETRALEEMKDKHKAAESDPFHVFSEEYAKKIEAQFGSNDTAQSDKVVDGVLRKCSRNIWLDRPLDKEEADALKANVDALKKTHGPLLNKYPVLSPTLSKNESLFREATADISNPIRVAVTGASGNIGYALLYRIASGDAFGPRTPIILQLLELPDAIGALQGVEMELRDCAFPNVLDIIVTDKPEVAFANVDYALLIGAFPRKDGMERSDLLKKNADVFSVQGKALNSVARGKDTRVIVVGNPANTNALIASRNAPKIPAQNFAAMTKLDHTRGIAQIAQKASCSVNDIKQFCIWGNHSATQFPDLSHATIKMKLASEVINDDAWCVQQFIPCVQQRGSAIIKARGKSSAASAASALIDNVREWHYGNTDWTSVAVASNGEYGVEKGLFFSYPITFEFQKWKIVENLPMSEFAQKCITATLKELQGERDAISSMLPKE